jgi:hypothetical protein
MIVDGVGGISTLALLAASSLVPMPSDGIATAAVVAWLGGLGSNVLASWLDQWAHNSLARAIGDAPDTERHRVGTLARDLQAQLAASDALAADIATLLDYTQAIQIVLDALQGPDGQQAKLLRRLLEDLQAPIFRNKHLHDVMLHAVVKQAEALHDIIGRSDTALLAEIRALQPGDAIQGDKVLGNKITTGAISIGGSVGTMQSVTVTGGTIQGPIIGSQTTHYGATSATRGATLMPGSQEDIEEQQELLAAYRRTLAVQLRRLAKLGDAHAPPEVAHGIHEARAGIQHCKATLRGWNVNVAEHPDDEGSE